MTALRDFYGPNAGYVAEQYARFLTDSSSVSDEMRRIFESGFSTEEAGTSSSAEPVRESWRSILATVSYARNLRQFGHLAARIDPLGSDRTGDPTLEREYYPLTDETLRFLPPDIVGGPLAAKAANALEALDRLGRVYMGTSGYDFEHVHVQAEREWLRDSIEGRRFSAPIMPFNDLEILSKLTLAETFEQFLQRSFPGKFRFSIEGVDMLVPMLGELVSLASAGGFKGVAIGMAHRGRLNVLAHILQLPYASIFAEFKDPARHRSSRVDLDWTGDVKYHLGGYMIDKNGSKNQISVFLAPNPSHLEAIDPVIEGMARAAGTNGRDSSNLFNPEITMPVLIHGDASFPGQGIVAETLNMSHLDGYSTGGTIHIITNNQLGYTATPYETRSTRYASDLAKGFEIPIIHVNADDPEGCIESVRIALAYREKFHKDFLVDLVGYRRHGHNESDEPTFTQPLMYEKIQNLPTVRQRWASILERKGEITAAESDRMVRENMERMQSALSSLVPESALIEKRPSVPPSGAARRVKTKVDAARLARINEKILTAPEGFTVHPKLERILEKRRHMLDDPGSSAVDWASAETIALASILEEGISIRFTGQDTERGTFGHRHAMFHDAKDGKTFVPLQSLFSESATFEIYNSPLTESAAIGFEYGYNVQEPGRLVIWEAQYGDFINNAQIMVDEFLTSARAKWGQTPSLVLLLPHAYEGQGPDHSSGRLERFLTLAAETNIRIANCTTSAQYFHLLRRQALLLKTDPLPLVIMTPKGLLRHPRTASAPGEFYEGRWEPVIDDPRSGFLKNTARRLALCSGKIFVDLVDSKYRQSNDALAIARVEQLYPFPATELRNLIANYDKIEEIVWVQEEPLNMGAWNYIRPLLHEATGNKISISSIGRAPNASPAEGSTSLHVLHQSEIVERTFNAAPGKANQDQIRSHGGTMLKMEKE